MSLSPGQYSNDDLISSPDRRYSDELGLSSPLSRSRPVDRALAVAERRTLTGALERVADRRPGMLVPEALYTNLDSDVASELRRLLLTLMSEDSMEAATEVCSAVVRLMALQPTRRWLDPALVLRVALLVHEKRGQDLPLLTMVRELLAAQGRWQAASVRHGEAIDTGDAEDWALLRELTALPLDFAPRLRSLIARSIIRQDLLGTRAHLATYSRQNPEAADYSRRQLNKHAPTLASLFGAELAPTRPMMQVSMPTVSSPAPALKRAARTVTQWVWPALMVCAALGVAAMLMAQPNMVQEQRQAVDQICKIVGAEHPSCLTASALGTGLDHGDCLMAGKALPILKDQLSNFGLNRELAVIRTDSLGQFRSPFDSLEYSFASRCL